MFRKVNVPVLGLVENMSTFVCPHCGEPSNIFGHGGARAEAARLGVAFLGEVPLTLTIRETSDEGRPVVATDPTSPGAEAFREIAARAFSELERSQGGARQAPRIVMES
jgi:ATP-binding protein involved in chromosome partitioning